MRYEDKVVVVTGAGGGVGQQLVLQLLEKGAFVAAVDVNPEALDRTKAQVDRPERLSIHQIDITDSSGVLQLAHEVKQTHGRVDGLINNAGIIQDFVTILKLKEDSIERLMNINFYGTMYMTRAFAPLLAERPEAFIGNVSSMGGFLPVPGQAIYGASKAAVKIATEGLRMELSKTTVNVSLILPGGIETDIKKNSGLETTNSTESEKKSAGIKVTSPEKAASVILKGIARNKAKILVGTDSVVMDILYRVMPIQAGKIISRVMAANHGGIFVME